MILHRAFPVLFLCLLVAACSGGGQGQPDDSAQPSEVEQTEGDVQLNLAMSGLTLGQLSAGFSTERKLDIRVSLPKQGTRRLYPGEIPDSIWLGDPLTVGQNVWRISDLPRDTNLLLLVYFTPGAGTVLPGTPAGQPALLSFPLFIPSGEDPAYAVNISFTSGGSGYLADSTLRRTDIEDSGMHTRLDYAAGLVARDSDGDGEFADEALLPDPQRNGISPQLAARLEQQNLRRAELSSTTLRAQIESVEMAGGRLVVKEYAADGSSGGGERRTVRFAEDAVFHQRIVDSNKVSSSGTAPQTLLGQRNVTLSVSSAGPLAAAGELWLDRAELLRLDLPPDSVAAVPLKQAARPGEAVPVTVFVNETAAPLHEVRKLRISFDPRNSYLSGSLDPGEAGGGAGQADGIWAASGAQSFILPAEDKLTSKEEKDGRSSIEFSLSPREAVQLNSASGALCSFSLICHSDTGLGVLKHSNGEAAAVYAGLDAVEVEWDQCLSADKPQVELSGEEIGFSLLSPQLPGAGHSSEDPYLAEPGSELRFSLIDPLEGEVSQAAQTVITMRGRDKLELQAHAGSLTIPADYRGMLRIKASYKGIYCPPESEIYVFVDDTSKFGLEVLERETSVFGGSAANFSYELLPDSGRGLIMLISADDVQDLHAFFCRVEYDRRLYYVQSSSPVDALKHGVSVIKPHLGQIGNDPLGHAELGYCFYNPQSSRGLSGEDCRLLEVCFGRYDAYFSEYMLPQVSKFAAPEMPAAQLSLLQGGSGLRWDYFAHGDFNQDGCVDFVNGGSSGIGDMTRLAMSIGIEDFSADSIEDLMDRRWDPGLSVFRGDGRINIGDAIGLTMGSSTKIEEWAVYFSDSTDNPAAGARLLDLVPFTAAIGDAAAERLHFEWLPEGGLQSGVYWVVPLCAGEEGAASPMLRVH